jgi:virulence-associated protein VapD
VYAIVFDLDQDALAQTYHDAGYKNAYGDIRKALEGHGFTRQQGSVYFGDGDRVNAVSCVLAVMDLAKANPWFASSVTDIRMLRIEDNNDLMPAVQKAVA